MPHHPAGTTPHARKAFAIKGALSNLGARRLSPFLSTPESPLKLTRPPLPLFLMMAFKRLPVLSAGQKHHASSGLLASTRGKQTNAGRRRLVGIHSFRCLLFARSKLVVNQAHESCLSFSSGFDFSSKPLRRPGAFCAWRR